MSSPYFHDPSSSRVRVWCPTSLMFKDASAVERGTWNEAWVERKDFNEIAPRLTSILLREEAAVQPVLPQLLQCLMKRRTSNVERGTWNGIQ
jgi:hypothetical protein